MAGSFFSVFDLLFLCIYWGAWFQYNTDAHQGGCRRVKFLPPVSGQYLEGHLFFNLTIGINTPCEHRCVLESKCVSVNIGPALNGRVICELSNSDHFKHPEHIKQRPGWIYRGTENPCSILNPCINNGHCLMGYTDKKYLCECVPEYGGEHCEKDIDECKTGSHDCNENAMCVNTIGHFNCSCNKSFSGDGKTCSDIDECEHGSHDCNENTTCVNTAGDFTCTCNPGYTGDGKTCSDIDECQNGSHDCNENATCVNTAGHFNCSFNKGFSGHGKTCSDIDECEHGSHDCNENATCVNAAGHFNCTCHPGYTGDGKTCSDCSSSLPRFQQYQDLPTRGAQDVEQFSINGSLFLAFANHYIVSEGYNTDSFIYNLNDSTETFSLYQTIDTTGALDIEYFTIADKHYLAVANFFDGATFQLNSVIYQWNGRQFDDVQNIPTNGAASFSYFEIFQEPFLAVTNKNGINSVIYKWNNNQFGEFQVIESEAASASTAFVINNETFIVFAENGNHSTVFKWSGNSFVQLQSLQTSEAADVKSFNINGDTFLACANHYDGSNLNIDSFIYKWNGSQFVLFQSIPTRGAQAWHPFVMCGQTFLAVANHMDDSQGLNTKSVIYRYSGEQFLQYQEIPTQGEVDVTSFERNDRTYLAITNYVNSDSKYNINSTLYKWI